MANENPEHNLVENEFYNDFIPPEIHVKNGQIWEEYTLILTWRQKARLAHKQLVDLEFQDGRTTIAVSFNLLFMAGKQAEHLATGKGHRIWLPGGMLGHTRRQVDRHQVPLSLQAWLPYFYEDDMGELTFPSRITGDPVPPVAAPLQPAQIGGLVNHCPNTNTTVNANANVGASAEASSNIALSNSRAHDIVVTGTSTNNSTQVPTRGVQGAEQAAPDTEVAKKYYPHDSELPTDNARALTKYERDPTREHVEDVEEESVDEPSQIRGRQTYSYRNGKLYNQGMRVQRDEQEDVPGLMERRRGKFYYGDDEDDLYWKKTGYDAATGKYTYERRYD